MTHLMCFNTFIPGTGRFRDDSVGQDNVCFFGTGTEAQMPRLVLTVSGPGPLVPVPVPIEPVSDPGTIISDTGSTLEVSCDGGTFSAIVCLRMPVCVSLMH